MKWGCIVFCGACSWHHSKQDLTLFINRYMLITQMDSSGYCHPLSREPGREFTIYFYFIRGVVCLHSLMLLYILFFLFPFFLRLSLLYILSLFSGTPYFSVTLLIKSSQHKWLLYTCMSRVLGFLVARWFQRHESKPIGSSTFE